MRYASVLPVVLTIFFTGTVFHSSVRVCAVYVREYHILFLLWFFSLNYKPRNALILDTRDAKLAEYGFQFPGKSSCLESLYDAAKSDFAYVAILKPVLIYHFIAKELDFWKIVGH